MKAGFNFRGVIEGFYGRPWSFDERSYLLERMQQWGLNIYMYAPKFDPAHRLQWRRLYDGTTLEKFQDLLTLSEKFDIRFVFALSPGLTIKADNSDDVSQLCAKYQQIFDLGCRNFALLMDDIPYETTNALQQSNLLSILMSAFPPEVEWFFCPTIYSGWHIKKHESAKNYLSTLGASLDKRVKVFWTGSSIISRSIREDDLLHPNQLLDRRVLIWDNLMANDYVPASTVFCGPISDRSPGLSECTEGILLNPSQSFHLSLLPIATLGSYCASPQQYSPESAWLFHLKSFFGENDFEIGMILGYFYSPSGVSPAWSTLLENIEFAISGDLSSLHAIEIRINEIIEMLHKDSHLLVYGRWWDELFPYMQTLYGDLKYLLDILKRCQEGERNPDRKFPLRDIRWSTAINQLIQKKLRDHLPSY